MWKCPLSSRLCVTVETRCWALQVKRAGRGDHQHLLHPILAPTRPCLHANLTRPAPPAGSGAALCESRRCQVEICGPSYCTVAHTDAFDRQLIRIHTQRSPQSKVIMSVGNWPADSDMIPAPVVTCLNNEITIKWQTCAPSTLHPRRFKALSPSHRRENRVLWRQKKKKHKLISE